MWQRTLNNLTSVQLDVLSFSMATPTNFHLVLSTLDVREGYTGSGVGAEHIFTVEFSKKNAIFTCQNRIGL